MISERTDVLIAPQDVIQRIGRVSKGGRRRVSPSLDEPERDVAIVRALRVIINHVFETGVLLGERKKKEKKKK